MAARFSLFNFLVTPDFPNNVPTMDEWGDFLPIFRGDDHDHLAQHLIEFHQYMNQLGIHHEDVLLKMFMYSLEENARQWYQSLPISSISSIKYFHASFYVYCKRIYSTDLLLEDCCEQFKCRKYLSNNDHDSLIDEIHEEFFHCEGQPSIEENIENHTIYEYL